MAKISVIISSWNEPKTIGHAIECVGDKSYSGIPDDFEIIQSSPDDITLEAGLAKAKALGIGEKFKQVKDSPMRGKPNALNMALKHVTGDIVIMTDGDVYFEKNAVKELVETFSNPLVGGVSGRPKASDTKDTMMGYFGNILADAADHKRRSTKEKFFPMSGYIYAIRKFDFEIPANTLVEDAYITHLIFNQGKKITYNPNAIVYVKYPETLDDYFKQKVRSLGGYTSLNKQSFVSPGTQSRTFFDELAYAFFPLMYAKSLKEFAWSLMLYPVRLLTWIKIKLYVKKMESKMGKAGGWARIETTKDHRTK